MSICEEHGNGVLVYDGYSCPACDHLDETVKEYEDQISDLNIELQDAQDREIEMQSEIDELKNR